MNALVSDFCVNAVPALIGDAGSFTLSCVGEAMAQDPDLGDYPVPASVQLGRFRSFDEVIACAERRGRQNGLCVDAIQSFKPNLLTITDRHQRLCLAGQLSKDGLIWCDPVTSDAEARGVVLKASGIRSRAMAAQDRDETNEARSLRFRAAAIEARLIDPAWRLASPARTARAA
ncbi:hypothetical protein [Ruegeria sp. EL01]|jgi:hypothetical protein|uniref:hypothetical protein n=1 Tax=Ruegeria sp. EL01 TaxID=2107578 RepID=UPI000EA8320C|nr:hypothetical protein [Ruegeria sp. EL01]